MLVAVIPTLNAADSLPATLAALEDTKAIVVDGGSADGTVEAARRHGAAVIVAPRGRGGQLAAGADAALLGGAEWLLFLHADSVPDRGWHAAAAGHMATRPDCAAAFRLSFADVPVRDRAHAARIERLANWRAHACGLPYGDQGLLIPAGLYRAVGGFRPDLPLMEDVDLVRRIGRRRLRMLDVAVRTSPIRYQRDGWWRRPLRNLTLLTLYFAGVPPRLLARLYG